MHSIKPDKHELSQIENPAQVPNEEVVGLAEDPQDVLGGMKFHTFVVYEFMLCSAVSIVLVRQHPNASHKSRIQCCLLT